MGLLNKIKHIGHAVGKTIHHAAHKVEKGVRHAAKTVGKAAHETAKFVQHDVFQSKFIQGLERNLVADSNINNVGNVAGDVLTNASTPLVTGIGGAAIAIAVVGGVFIASKL